MGNAVHSSRADPSSVKLVWITDYALSTCNFEAGFCCGLKELKDPLPPWLSQSDYDRIIAIGEPYGDYLCPLHCCGQPCSQSPFSPNGGPPIDQMRKEIGMSKGLIFEFKADFVGCDKQMHWEHIITIRPGNTNSMIPNNGLAPGFQMMGQQQQPMANLNLQPGQAVFMAQVPPNSIPGQMMNVAAPDGQMLQFQLPPNAITGMQIPITYVPRTM